MRQCRVVGHAGRLAMGEVAESGRDGTYFPSGYVKNRITCTVKTRIE